MNLVILNEMVELQKKKVMVCATKLVPYITQEDLLQPQDFVELEHNPEFRYEEGVLHGLESALSALRVN